MIRQSESTSQFGPLSQEAIRRRLIILCLLFYWCMLFDGAARKWLLPEGQAFIYFAKDLLVLYAYYLASRYRLWPSLSGVFLVGVVISVLFIPLIYLQVLLLHLNPLIGLYGWRMYFFYMPFAFLMGHNLRRVDINRIMKHAMVAAIVLLPIVYIQFHSPKDAWINRTYDERLKPSELTKDILRPAGTFSNSGQEAHYLGSLWPYCLQLCLSPSFGNAVSPALGIIFAGATITLLLYNGHRLAYLMAALCILVGLIASFLLPRKRLPQRLMILLGVVLIAGIAFKFVFSEAFEAMESRFISAEQSPYNPVGTRIARAFSSTLESMHSNNLLGWGIGLGSGGAQFIRGELAWVLSEDQWACIVDEGGLCGLIFIGYRLWLVGWLALGALNATRKTHDPLPLLLASYTGIMLGYAQMTMNGTIDALGWFFVGVNIAANRFRTLPKQPQGAHDSSPTQCTI